MIFDAGNELSSGTQMTGQSAEVLIQKMDWAGIAKAVVFSPVEKIDNEYISRMTLKYHQRFVGYAVVNSIETDAEQAFSTCIHQYGLKGLKLDTPHNGYALNNFSHLDPLLTICNRYHMPVMAYGADDNAFTHPYKFGELARQYPNANFIIAHMGMFNATAQAAEMAKKHKNVYLDISGAYGLAVEQAVRVGGAEKVLFGTNSPFGFFEVTKLTVDRAVLDHAGRRLIYGENMERIMNEITLQKRGSYV